MTPRAAIRLAAALLSLLLGVASIILLDHHYIPAMLCLGAAGTLIALVVHLDPRYRAAKGIGVCEIPHPTREEEDTCERRRIAAKGDRP